MMIEGILFDKDGTLFDFAATWEAWAGAMLARLSGGDEGLKRALGEAIGYDVARGHFRPDSLVIAGTAGAATAAMAPHLDMAPAALEALLNEEAAQAPMAEAVPLAPLLQLLRDRGLMLGVATNDAEAPARAHLDQAGVTGLFDFIAGYDSGFGAKPGPGMCLGFCEDRGLDPARVAMVGDSLHDLHAGRAAGMKTIAVLTGPASEDELAPHADAVLPDIGHLPRWLAGR